MVVRILLAAAFVAATSTAWADGSCPRMQQNAAYVALLESQKATATAQPATEADAITLPEATGEGVETAQAVE